MKSKYEILGKEKLQEIVNSVSSLRQIVEKVGLSPNGSGGYFTLRKYIKILEIDLSKLEENKLENYKKREVKNRIYNLENLFIENSLTSRNIVRKFILKYDLIEYKCSKCNNDGNWFDENLSLQLEHKNGVNNDHRLENLEFLCPNCHGQTKTFGSKNGKKEIKKQVKEKKKAKENNLLLEKIENRKEKLNEINLMKFGWVEEVSKKWNVSHTQVRRWMKKYYPEIKFYERNIAP